MLDLTYVIKYTRESPNRYSSFLSLTTGSVIFTAVVATFFILMAFKINEILDFLWRLIGKDSSKKLNSKKRLKRRAPRNARTATTRRSKLRPWSSNSHRNKQLGTLSELESGQRKVTEE
jgi:hypothetical protein